MRRAIGGVATTSTTTNDRGRKWPERTKGILGLCKAVTLTEESAEGRNNDAPRESGLALFRFGESHSSRSRNILRTVHDCGTKTGARKSVQRLHCAMSPVHESRNTDRGGGGGRRRHTEPEGHGRIRSSHFASVPGCPCTTPGRPWTGSDGRGLPRLLAEGPHKNPRVAAPKCDSGLYSYADIGAVYVVHTSVTGRLTRMDSA